MFHKTQGMFLNIVQTFHMVFKEKQENNALTSK
jgi:hypothetical protein